MHKPGFPSIPVTGPVTAQDRFCHRPVHSCDRSCPRAAAALTSGSCCPAPPNIHVTRVRVNHESENVFGPDILETINCCFQNSWFSSSTWPLPTICYWQWSVFGVTISFGRKSTPRKYTIAPSNWKIAWTYFGWMPWGFRAALSGCPVAKLRA